MEIFNYVREQLLIEQHMEEKYVVRKLSKKVFGKSRLQRSKEAAKRQDTIDKKAYKWNAGDQTDAARLSGPANPDLKKYLRDKKLANLELGKKHVKRTARHLKRVEKVGKK